MTGLEPGAVATGVLVLPSSRAASRELGPLAWRLLEELALEAQANGTLATQTSVRTLAAELKVGKEAAASAIHRLVEFGVVACQPCRRAGRYAGSSYVLDIDACRRAGLVITSVASPDAPCPASPCPANRDTVEPCSDERDAPERLTAQRDVASPEPEVPESTAPEPASRSIRATQRDAAAQSLFDFCDPPSTSRAPEPSAPPIPDPTTDRARAEPEPDPNPSPSAFLTSTAQQGDTSAPGVRQEGVGSL